VQNKYSKIKIKIIKKTLLQSIQDIL
jgi:hypothetical protein